MKDLKLLYTFFILSLFISSAKSIAPDIYYIIASNKNGTEAYVDLETVEDNYIYFSFDFDEYYKDFSKDNAYFNVKPDFELLKDSSASISYGFVEQAWYDIESASKIKDIKWENVNYSYKENSDSNYNYYYELKRQDSKMKTLLLRVPKLDNKKGGLSVLNIESLPGGNGKDNAGNILSLKMMSLLLFILNIW